MAGDEDFDAREPGDGYYDGDYDGDYDLHDAHALRAAVGPTAAAEMGTSHVGRRAARARGPRGPGAAQRADGRTEVVAAEDGQPIDCSALCANGDGAGSAGLISSLLGCLSVDNAADDPVIPRRIETEANPRVVLDLTGEPAEPRRS